MKALKKFITTAAAFVALGSFAGVTSLPLVKGDNPVPTAKVIAVKAVGSTASGTLSIGEVIEVASVSTNSVTVTNVIPANATYQVADAYVGMTRVYTGSDATEWAITNEVVTNIVGSVTNVYTIKVATLSDNGTPKFHAVTNQACSVGYRDVIATVPVTNIVTSAKFVWTRTPYTNEIYSGSMSGGKLSAVTNLVILGGKVSVSGTALDGGNAYLVLER